MTTIVQYAYRYAQHTMPAVIAFRPAYHDEIDECDRVQLHVPEVHQAEHVDGDHRDCHDDVERRPDVEAEQKEADDEDGRRTDAEVLRRLRPDVEVLLVEDVERTGSNGGRGTSVCVSCFIFSFFSEFVINFHFFLIFSEYPRYFDLFHFVFF